MGCARSMGDLALLLDSSYEQCRKSNILSTGDWISILTNTSGEKSGIGFSLSSISGIYC